VTGEGSVTDATSSDADPEPDADARDADPDRPGDPGSGTTDGRPVGATPNPRIGEGLLDADMGPSSAFAHLYRGELHRMKLWRERLDRTTNWSVLLMAAVLTWAFTNPSNPHYVLLVGGLAVALLLRLEAHRYRAYDVWRSRVRSLQRNVWATGLDPDRGLGDEEWRRRLADDYDEPTVKITTEEALAHRLRRVYLPLFAVFTLAWTLRVTAFGPQAWPASARIGPVSGTVVTAGVALAVLAAVVVAVRPRTWHASDELRTESLRRADG
jgi:uncharacterized membrane protein